MEQAASHDDHNRPTGIIPLASHTLFAGASVEEMCAFVADLFNPYELRVLGDSPLFGHFRATPPQGAVSLSVIGYGADVRLRPATIDDFYGVALPLSGRAWMSADRERVTSDGQTGWLIGPEQQLRLRYSSDNIHLALRVSRQAIDQAVRDHLGDESTGPLRFAAGMDLSRPAARQWSKLVHLLAEEVECGALLNSPLAARHFEQLLIHGLLTAQPHNLSEALPGRQHAISPPAIRRAVRFCEEHAAEPISVADIATAARTSIRTLHQQFRRHLGLTPMQYLQQVRLHHAHADLLAIAHGQSFGTVTEVAYRWGFAHLSRFAAAYRRAYGRLPSQTLRAQ